MTVLFSVTASEGPLQSCLRGTQKGFKKVLFDDARHGPTGAWTWSLGGDCLRFFACDEECCLCCVLTVLCVRLCPRARRARSGAASSLAAWHDEQCVWDRTPTKMRMHCAFVFSSILFNVQTHGRTAGRDQSRVRQV